MILLRRALLPLVLAALAACAALPEARGAPPAVVAAPGPVILVSIDGFRADYLQRGITPAIAALAADGVRSTGMRPSYPSLTFPNHYTLVTGRRPDHHGIVDNTMEDPQIPGVTFSLGNAAAVKDRRWWDDAEPLWVTAQKQGVNSGTMFWPGSEADIHGVRPKHFLAYDKKMAGDARVDQVLAWLDLPPGERPRFITLYFDKVDTAGHDGGPDSEEVNAALRETDASIARLVEGLKARNLYGATNLVIVADHGMAPTSPDRQVFLDDIAPKDSFRMITGGTGATIVPTPGREAEAARLVGRHPHATCWYKAKIPARYHFGTHRRIPPIVCLAETRWLVTTRERAAKGKQKPGGAHGFDPYSPEMAALFVGHGPAFRRGAVIGGFDNVAVYPLLARLIGVTPLKGDGRLADLKGALAHP
jgi:predicted AlkP superfamily pyrophosphatase or phosphodiesterase